MDLPNCGCGPDTGFSASSGMIVVFGVCILAPSTKMPFAAKNERIEQFWMYGDLEIKGLSDLTAYPTLLVKASAGSSNAIA